MHEQVMGPETVISWPFLQKGGQSLKHGISDYDSDGYSVCAPSTPADCIASAAHPLATTTAPFKSTQHAVGAHSRAACCTHCAHCTWQIMCAKQSGILGVPGVI